VLEIRGKVARLGERAWSRLRRRDRFSNEMLSGFGFLPQRSLVVRAVATGSLLGAVLLGACSGGGSNHNPAGPTPSPKPTSSSGATPTPMPTPTGSSADHFVYYSTLNLNLDAPSLGGVTYPMTSTSAPALTIDGSSANKLTGAAPLLIDSSGRLWALSGLNSPAIIGIFDTPLTSTSVPNVVLTLPGGVVANAMAFDSSGNLWVASWNAGAISAYEFTGPFNVSATLVAAHHFPVAGCSDSASYFGVALSPSDDLYVTCNASPAASSIAVLLKSTSYGSVDHYLSGLGNSSALVFDFAGDLYAGSNSAAPAGGICLFKSGNLGAEATPSVCDSTGMGTSYWPFQLALDSAGNIYSANCVDLPPHLFVYPTSTLPLSATLAPSAIYSDANIEASECAAGVAIH
jgi:hypothetical protein